MARSRKILIPSALRYPLEGPVLFKQTLADGRLFLSDQIIAAPRSMWDVSDEMVEEAGVTTHLERLYRAVERSSAKPRKASILAVDPQKKRYQHLSHVRVVVADDGEVLGALRADVADNVARIGTDAVFKIHVHQGLDMLVVKTKQRDFVLAAMFNIDLPSSKAFKDSLIKE